MRAGSYSKASLSFAIEYKELPYVKLLIKRIAAKEGDMVEHKWGKLYIPDDKHYVMGDSEEFSEDSHLWEDPFINSGSVIAIILGN